jgi:cation:H+ antiporter
MILSILLFVIGLALVVKGAEGLLASVEKIGVTLGLPAFILGVVLVGFGTSLPELTTSVAGVLNDVDTLSIPNIAGSNIANVLVILAVCTIVYGTVKFEKNLIDLDLPLLVSITALFIILLVDGSLSRFDGILLLGGFAGYMMYSLYYREDKQFHSGLITMISNLTKGSPEKIEKHQNLMTRWTVPIAILSLIFLAGGSKIAVDNLLLIVEEINIGVEVMSFFALAVGTSLPELVVSLKAHKRGQGDLVLGNIIGSCMFNILLIGGLTSVIRPQLLDSALVPWTIVGLVVSVGFIVVSGMTRRIHIWEGYTYMLVYVALAAKIINVT